MTKLFFFMLCMVVMAASCKKETPADPIKFSLDATTASGTDRVGNVDISSKIHIINTDDETIVFRWKRVPINFPTGWVLSTCTFGNCYDPAVETQTITLPMGDTVEVKQNFNPMNVAGTGSTKILFYDPTDSAATVKEAIFSATAN